MRVCPCTARCGPSDCMLQQAILSGTNVQDYDEALSLDAHCVVALVRKGKALWALKRTEVLYQCCCCSNAR